MFEKYFDAMRRLKKQLAPVAEHYNKGMAYFWIDALMAHLRYGVTPNQYIGYEFYRKRGIDRKRFYTGSNIIKYEKRLNDPNFYDSFWNKVKFNLTFENFIHREWLFCDDETKSIEIQDFINQHKKVIVKPTNLSSGRGIHVYSGESISELIEEKVLLEEFVIQSSKLSALNPSSVNTVRVYTMIDRKEEIHILTASLRVGGHNSEVDNFHSGGVGYPLDVDSGVVMSSGRDIMGRQYLYHPGTNAKVIGFEIPNWSGLVEFVFEACRVIPTARLIAWDVAVLEDGFELIEGNYDGDPGFMQAPSNTGMLPAIKAFF